MNKRFALSAAVLTATGALLTGCAFPVEAEPQPTANNNTLFWAVAESYNVPGLNRNNTELRPRAEALAREACSGWRSGLSMAETQLTIDQSEEPATIHAVFVAAGTVYCPAYKNLVWNLNG